MQPNDFFKESNLDTSWGQSVPGPLKLDRGLVRELRRGNVPGCNDVEAAIGLLRLVWGELEAYGTDGSQRIDDEEAIEVQRALIAILRRLGIELKIPWKGLIGFKTYWINNGGYGSWQARREILTSLFSPIDDQLEEMEYRQFQSEVADAVSPHGVLGWVEVDDEVSQLKQRFRTAATRQDYRDVGNRCVATLEALSRVVYDPVRHLREGEGVPSPDKTKQRIERYVEDSLAGSENEKVRAVAKKVIELAHSVKHSPDPSRRAAGIAADSVILLAHILRRVEQDE